MTFGLIAYFVRFRRMVSKRLYGVLFWQRLKESGEPCKLGDMVGWEKLIIHLLFKAKIIWGFKFWSSTFYRGDILHIAALTIRIEIPCIYFLIGILQMEKHFFFSLISFLASKKYQGSINFFLGCHAVRWILFWNLILKYTHVAILLILMEFNSKIVF